MTTPSDVSVIESDDSPVLLEYAIQPRMIGEEWEVVSSLPVILGLDAETGEYTLADELFFVYGIGTTPGLAEQDYLANLAVYADLVAESSNSDDPTKHTFFEFFQQYLRHKV